ncbi:asialoglycoprotein receptor 1-like [Alligator mississippiensis]|uniref:Asialoglycoprotein receptor 1-like n=1 Tax=Alligator mississippiensis TaxID=8496 RepID=A0A151NK16_ALLMI|nr:asialoglycoprotein receptor 1-like [Alligator mississippiensis]
MAKDYPDFQPLDVHEELGPRLPAGPSPSRAMACTRLLPPSRLALLALVLGLGLSLGSIALSVRSSHLGEEQQVLQGMLQALNDTGHSLAHRLGQLEHTLARLEVAQGQDRAHAQEGQADATAQLRGLRSQLNAFGCDLQALKSNASRRECCPAGWDRFALSCYFFSRERRPWPEAEQWCRALGARLVVINTPAEQQFVQQHTIPTFTWIGLSDAKGKWEWVDGTPYILDPRDWSPGQPDNWTGHGQGDGEDCVAVIEEGLWNDDRCSRGFPWVCEVTLDPPLASPSPQEAGPDRASSHSPP